MGFEPERVALMDNGSLRPEAVRGLRNLAKSLGGRIGRRVDAVSLLHSNKVPEVEIGGVRAETMIPYLKRLRKGGWGRVLVLPLFFGPSAAVTDYLPRRLGELGEDVPEVRIGETIVVGDERDREVAGLLAQGVRDVISERELTYPAVALVDHGSPLKAVNDVRERMASLMAEELGEQVAGVAGCSMERREGEAYDFNEPMLADLLAERERDVVVSLLFAAAGRHAGEGGDVARICAEAEQARPGLGVYPTGLFTNDEDAVVEILIERYGAAVCG